MNKHNYFVKFLIKINHCINSLLKRNLNKLNSANLKKILINNKISLAIVLLAILFFSYLSLPNIFNKNQISVELKKELLDKLNLEFNFEKKLDYKFLPRPHFITSESSIALNENKISKINKLKIYVSLESLFSLKNMKVKNVIIKEANFNLNKNNYSFFIKLLDSNFEDIKLEILDSNIFYKNIENDVLFINHINRAKYIYDPKEFKNILYSKNNIFNLPYSLEASINKDEKKFNSKINIRSLNLKLENQFSYGEELKSGLSEFNFFNEKSIAEYKLGKNNFEFKLFDKTQKSKFFYNGKLNFRPFYSYLMGSATTIDFSHLFSTNAIIKQLLKTEILNNKNIDFKLNISANKTKNFDNFTNIFLNSKIQEGLIDLDQTKFSWKNHANFSLTDSLIYIKNGKLFLEGNSEIKLINLDEIYKFLITPKNSRKKINKININFTYIFDEKTLNINDIKVDNISNKNLLNNLNEINLKENSLQNKVYLKKYLNDVIKNYAG
ncbi:AsmA family protein [Candidatus Pelagibacter sp.]|nr:AsmA family protein [Candidatus Pelagibacter sp.]